MNTLPACTHEVLPITAPLGTRCPVCDQIAPYGEAPNGDVMAMRLMGIKPEAPSNPFARGALIPWEVETKNSTYVITQHALRVDEPATVTVACTRGTFEGQGWNMPASRVALTRDAFYAGALRTTAPVRVNRYPVDTWD